MPGKKFVHGTKLAQGILAAAAVSLALTACDSPEPGGTPTSGAPAPEPAPTVTVTATETPEAVATPDYGFTFFHEAQVGQSFAAAGTALHYPIAGLADCPYYGPIWETALANTYAFTDSMDPGAGISFFYTMQYLGAPGDPWPTNAEGVGIGSTQAEITAAYPSAVVATTNDLGAGDLTTITVDDPDSDSQYVFAITAGNTTVDLLQWGPGAGAQWSHLCGGF